MTKTSRIVVAALALGLSVAGLARGGDIKTYRLSVNPINVGSVVAASVQGPKVNGEGNGPSALSTPSISADGSLVVFDSEATNLEMPAVLDGTAVADTNDASDIFVHDVRTRVNRRVSLTAGGAQANGPSRNPVISADGRFVAFESEATNLVSADTDSMTDIYAVSLQTGAVWWVSRGSGGGPNGPSRDPEISGNGDLIVFASDAANLVPGDVNGATDVFAAFGIPRGARVTVLMSRGIDDAPANGASSAPAVSVDGTVVAFASEANNLVPGDDNGVRDVFTTGGLGGGPTELVSRAFDGKTNGPSGAPSIGGATGNIVAFESDATNIVPGDLNGVTDVFARIGDGGALLVSRQQGGQLAHGASRAPAASATGIAFVSSAYGEPGSPAGVFLFDVVTNQVEMVTSDGVKDDADAYAPAISADGVLIAYGSDSTVIDPRDTNGVRDLFGRIDERRCANGAVEDGPVSGPLSESEAALGRASWVGHHVACAVASLGL